MKRNIAAILVFLAFCGSIFSQKKTLTPAAYDSWESISNVQVSNDGRHVAYSISPQDGDSTLVIKNINTLKEVNVERGQHAQLF